MKVKGYKPIFNTVWRAVVFQYDKHPCKWHIHCLENGASGWGDTLKQAIDELLYTLEAQLNQTLNSGVDYFFPYGQPDEDWVRAFERGKHPDHEIKVKGSFKLIFELGTKDNAMKSV